jgi:pyruvate kinase
MKKQQTKRSATQIVGTVGPASSSVAKLKRLISAGLDVARLNFSWGNLKEHEELMTNIRKASRQNNRSVPIIQDVPGPRQQTDDGHSVKADRSAVTDRDKSFIEFGVDHGVDYVAISFVSSATDVQTAQEIAGDVPVIAKVERREALDTLSEIIAVSDGVMVARGDLGKNIAIQKLPFVEEEIIHRANEADTPVITATEMLASMEHNLTPTRAEVIDVAWATRLGSDAVMLSEETAIGQNPTAAVKTMEQIIRYAENYQPGRLSLHEL